MMSGRSLASPFDKDLPKLTASLNRKLAVTTIQEAGANRQTQTALAKLLHVDKL